MPSIRASSRPNLAGWQPAQNAPAGLAITGNSPAQQSPLARSPYMQASMPLMASTGDAFARQFYAQNGLPSQRILPVGKGGRA